MHHARGHLSLPWQSKNDSREDFAISSVQSNHSNHAWLHCCSRCHGKPCQILPVKEHPGWEAFPTTPWCWRERQEAGMAGAYLSQPGLCQPAHDTWLLNHSRQLMEIIACVALTSVLVTAGRLPSNRSRM